MYIIKGELERFRLTLIVGKAESPVAGIEGQGVAEIPVIGCLCTRVAHAQTIAYPQQISLPKHNSSLERIDAE